MNDQHKQLPPLSDRELNDFQEAVLAKLKNYLNEESQDIEELPIDVGQAQMLLEMLVQQGKLAGEIRRLKSLKGLYLFCVGERLIDASGCYLEPGNCGIGVKNLFPNHCVYFATSHYTLRPFSETVTDIGKVIPRRREGMTDKDLSFYNMYHLGLHPIQIWEEGEAGEGYVQYNLHSDPSIPSLKYIRLPRWNSCFAEKYPHAIFQCWFPGHNAKHAFATIGGVVVEHIKDATQNFLDDIGIVRVFAPLRQK